MTKLHLGLTPWNFSNLSAHSLCDQAQFAEECGYQSLWLPENHFGESALPDPLTLLAAVAGVTKTIKLGTTSYLLTLRNPLQAAEQVAVFDQMSGGRLILGVGRGYAPEMLRAFHVPVAEKRRIFAWTLDIMRRAWAGEAVTLDNEPENAIKVYPRPAQQPEPPIWVAAFGPRRWLKPVAWVALFVVADGKSGHAARKLCSASGGCGGCRVTPPEVLPLMRTVFVSHDTSECQRLRECLPLRPTIAVCRTVRALTIGPLLVNRVSFASAYRNTSSPWA